LPCESIPLTCKTCHPKLVLGGPYGLVQSGFGFNDNDQCIPIGKCPDGYGRLDDDETGKCYKNSVIKICPDGYVTHKNEQCPPSPYPTLNSTDYCVSFVTPPIRYRM
jgi:hypothetical protein